MSDIPAYVDMQRLSRELGRCEMTIRRWMKKGFPKPKRHGLWSWAEVRLYMDGRKKSALASEALSQEEEIRNAAKTFALFH